MYRVVTKFLDKYNPHRYYNVGDEFISDDKLRIEDLLSRGLISLEEKKVKPVKQGSRKKKADE